MTNRDLIQLVCWLVVLGVFVGAFVAVGFKP